MKGAGALIHPCLSSDMTANWTNHIETRYDKPRPQLCFLGFIKIKVDKLLSTWCAHWRTHIGRQTFDAIHCTQVSSENHWKSSSSNVTLSVRPHIILHWPFHVKSWWLAQGKHSMNTFILVISTLVKQKRNTSRRYLYKWGQHTVVRREY